MSIKYEVLEFIKKNKKRFKKEYGVKEIYLFGSVARGEDTQKSDIDLLVEFDENRVVTLFTYMDFINEFENKFNRKVDVATKEMIKPLLWKYLQEDLIDA